MTSGNDTTTISINLLANDMLEVLAKHHSMSKVALVSAIITGLATLDDEQVEGIIAGGKITAILVTLGATIDYPNGIITKNSLIAAPILRILTPENS